MGTEPWEQAGETPDVGELVGSLRGEVRPRPEFREALLADLRREQRRLYGREESREPDLLAYCPFTTFCFARLRLPAAVRKRCPCLAAAGPLAALAERGAPVRRRRCEGLRLRAAAAG